VTPSRVAPVAQAAAAAVVGWEQLAAGLRRTLGDTVALWFAGARPLTVEAGVLVLALPNDFSREWIEGHFREVLDRCAAGAALAGVRLVVDELAETAAVSDEEELRGAETPHERQKELPPVLLARLLAQRGFWSLSPAADRERFDVTDVRGDLQVITSALGVPGVFEAMVFNGLLSVWANGARETPDAVCSARELASVLGLAWHGELAERLRHAVGVLKATTYRLELERGNGGWTDDFSLLDRVQTAWDGARTSPHRAMRAVFSEVVFEQITQSRMLRPLDLTTFRAIDEKSHLARRLFLFLEASPASVQLGRGREGLERIVDGRLAGTLGVRSELKHFRPTLARAGATVVRAAPRYEHIEVVPRAKRALRSGEPRYVLRIVRARAALAC
jgi:DnaA N-terminal domain